MRRRSAAVSGVPSVPSVPGVPGVRRFSQNKSFCTLACSIYFLFFFIFALACVRFSFCCYLFVYWLWNEFIFPLFFFCYSPFRPSLPQISCFWSTKFTGCSRCVAIGCIYPTISPPPHFVPTRLILRCSFPVGESEKNEASGNLSAKRFVLPCKGFWLAVFTFGCS